MARLAAAALLLAAQLLLLPRLAAPCSPPGVVSCETQPGCEPPKLKAKTVAGLPPWQPGNEPTPQGCFTDHAPQQHGEAKGTRLLECGVWHCSGGYGCGGGSVGTGCPPDDCPPWPSGTPQCSSDQMSIEYCVQNCLKWSPEFIYAGVTNGNECWCDVALNVFKTGNTCVDHTGNYCKDNCKGDATQNCGAPWVVNVYRIRPDVALALDETSWTLVVLLIAGGSAYVVGGAVVGARRRGDAGKVPSVKAHIHWDRWVLIYGLCQDGLAYSRGRLGLSGGRPVSRQSQAPLLEEGGRGSKSSSRRGSASSSSKGKKAKDEGRREKRGGGSREKKSSKRSKGKGDDPAAVPDGEAVTAAAEEEAEAERQLQEQRSAGVHSSQQAIKVVGING